MLQQSYALCFLAFYNMNIHNHHINFVKIQRMNDYMNVLPGLAPAWLPEALSDPLKRPASEKSTTLSSDAWKQKNHSSTRKAILLGTYTHSALYFQSGLAISLFVYYFRFG